jgi:hypothetical protein
VISFAAPRAFSGRSHALASGSVYITDAGTTVS